MKGGVAMGCAPFSCAVAVDSAEAGGYLGPIQSAPEGLAHEDAERHSLHLFELF
ncbi:hypothetical protein SAMN04489759_10527 [Sulfitobacter delicatus]|uniref:Uncharacterized protein n=1 Tax=Sulfitobacter delicatus TaxID=218672 RepID=A0A1G7RWV3_9RHOB|nr:hypothetical protein SAMN04489759_10527 [Sulfitobacter delicatus]